jgi:pyruvate dehydrogenase E2 component (dihydrolipoamide acetyltransferase)
MAEKLIVPKLGMAASEVTLTEWKAKEGDRIQKGNPVLDVEAEKTVFEMTAPCDGYLHIMLAEGVETAVSSVVGLIAATKEEYSSILNDGGQSEFAGKLSEEPLADNAGGASDGPAKSSVLATPIARRIAADSNIELSTIVGTGKDSLIERRDVEAAIAVRSGQEQVSATQPDDTIASAQRRIKLTIPYRGMRKTVGENMIKSLTVNAPNTMSGDFDLTVLAKYRQNLLEHERELGIRITFSDMLLYAASRALKKFPLINSSLIGDEIMIWDNVNLGMAVALGEHGDGGLVVPVIKDADQKSLVEISKIAKDLAARARVGKLQASEMAGGTFTVSNFGSQGTSSYSTPILNVPESGILAIGRLQKKPVVKDDEVVIASILPYSLTHDHRLIDGAAAEYFLSVVKVIIEEPDQDFGETHLSLP